MGHTKWTWMAKITKKSAICFLWVTYDWIWLGMDIFSIRFICPIYSINPFASVDTLLSYQSCLSHRSDHVRSIWSTCETETSLALESLQSHTLPETNIAPESGWLENQFPFGMTYFQVRTGSFRTLTSNRFIHKPEASWTNQLGITSSRGFVCRPLLWQPFAKYVLNVTIIYGIIRNHTKIPNRLAYILHVLTGCGRRDFDIQWCIRLTKVFA